MSAAKALEDEEKEEDEEEEEYGLKEDADETIGDEFILRAAGLRRSLPTELCSESFSV